MNLDRVFKEVGKHQLLTKEQEVQLAQAIENGDRQARDKMIQSNLRLAISIAKQYNRSGCSLDDLIQESTLGLMEAVDRFDWRRGFKFSTYACWWIKQAVRRHVAANSSIIRLPNHANTVLWQAGQLRRDYIETYGHEPQPTEIASAMGVSVDMLTSLRACAAPTISLDKPVGADADGSRKLYEVIPDESGSVLDIMMSEDMKELIRQAFSSLSPREEKVIRLRFGISASSDDSVNFPITNAELNKLEERSHANA